MPAGAEVMRDIPDDDEGAADMSSQQRIMRVHRNLGHPSNRLLVQIIKGANALASVIDIASKLDVHFVLTMFALLLPDQRTLTGREN